VLLFLKSKRKGYVFTIEAIISLLCFAMLASLLSIMSFPNFDEVVVYKQASDVLEVSLKQEWIVDRDDVKDTEIIKGMGALGLKGEMVVDGKTYPLITGKKNMEVTVKRTFVSPDLKIKEVELRAFK